MREILFRGKRIDNGEWVEGAFSPKNSDPLFGPMLDKPSIIKQESPLAGFWFDVDPETVGQYTGMTDKNGKKIFEGDILKIAWYAPGREPVYENHEVVYSKSGFFTKRNGKLLGQVSNYISPSANMQCKVIGNIHDSPELLEVDHE